VVYYAFSDGLSSILTLSAGLQTLGFLLLAIKVWYHGGVSGISTKMLGLLVMALALRLSNTLQFQGYLPVDSTGDGPFQCLEILSLGIASGLLFKVMRTRRMTMGGSAQQDQDSMPGLHYIVLACLCVAALAHNDLSCVKCEEDDDSNPFYDIVWAFACNLEAAAIAPQLWMMSKAGGEVEALTGHFIMLTTLARFLSLSFWYLDCRDFVLSFFQHGAYHPELVIIAAHVLQLILSCDFLVLYFKSFGKNVLISRSFEV